MIKNVNSDSYFSFKAKNNIGASLVVKNLPANERTWVQSLIWEDPTWCGATKPVHHNYWAYVLQLLKPVHPRAPAPQQEATAMRRLYIATKREPHSLQLEQRLNSKTTQDSQK